MGRPVVLITGTSRGIGAACARLAAIDGYDVCVHYHKAHQQAQTVVSALQVLGAKAVPIAADIANEDEVVALFQAIDTHFGRLDALVNNAGILAQQMPVGEMSAERLNRIFSVNITGAFLCAREAIRRMSTLHHGQGGAIVNVSSVAARLGSAGEYVDYAASKGAMDTFTIGLAQEVAGQGIRVNAVRPGFIDTDIHASGGEPDRIARISPNIPMQRGGHADEVAHAIIWLLSQEASYTSGALLDIAGGR